MCEFSTASRSRALPPDEHVDLAVEVFQMFADATRVRLLWLLQGGESPVSELTRAVGKPQSLVSQHLAKLRMARLVLTRRQGSHIYYRLTNEHVAQLVADAIHNAEHYGPGVPAHHQHSPVGKVHESARTPRRGRAT